MVPKIIKIKETRKSQAHLEVILSLVIFVGFLIAILFFLKPFNVQKQSYASLDEVQSRIMENITLNYQTVSLILDSNTGSGCFSVNNSLSSGQSILVLDSLGNVLASTHDSEKISINYPLTGADKRYYKILLSDSFNSISSNLDSPCSSAEGYSFGALTFENAIFYDSLADFNNAYLTNYVGFGNSLGITSDFNFVVYDFQKNQLFNESLNKNSALMGNVMARDIPFTLLNSTGFKQPIIFNLRVW